MEGYRYGEGGIAGRLLQDGMATSLTDLLEAMRFKIVQASLPDRTRSLPNRDLDLCHEYFAVQTALDFRWVGGFEEKGQSLDQIGSGFLDGLALAGDIKLRAKRDIAIVLPLDDGGELANGPHVVIVNGFTLRGRARARIGGRTPRR